jgi:hypothetical protein
MEVWDPHGFAVVLTVCFVVYAGLLVVRRPRAGD